MRAAIVSVGALVLVGAGIWIVRANETLPLPDLPSLQQDTSEWRRVSVGDVLDGFDANPHRAERDFQNVRIVGQVYGFPEEFDSPHIVLHDRLGWFGLLVPVDAATAAELDFGSTVVVHCGKAEADYRSPRDYGAGWLGPWCSDVVRVERASANAPPTPTAEQWAPPIATPTPMPTPTPRPTKYCTKEGAHLYVYEDEPCPEGSGPLPSVWD